MGKLRAAVVVTCALTGWCALAGCADRTPRPPKFEDPESQAKLAKLQPYVACLDGHTEHVFELADRVREQARLHGAMVTIHATPDPRSCLEGIEKASKRPPSWPDLEAKAAAFAAALMAVHALSSEGERAGAAGVQPRLLAALDTFDRAQGDLFDHVRRTNHEVHAADLTRREQKEGSTLAIRIEKVLLHAERMIAGAVVPWERLDTLDLASLALDLLQLESLAQDMSNRALAEPKEASAFDGYYNLEHHAGELVVACKQLLHRAREKVAYSDTDRLMIGAGNEADVVGTPASVIRAYNKLVDTYGVR